jgi:hypothetical protein
MSGDGNCPNLGCVIYYSCPRRYDLIEVGWRMKGRCVGGAISDLVISGICQLGVFQVIVMRIIITTSRATRLHIGRHLCTTH